MHMCVCVIFLHHSVVLFYSSILLLWYVGYDDFISMSNVFVFVLIILILLLVLLLANIKMNILKKSLFSISHKFLYFSLFFHFNFLHYFPSIYIFLINFCFSVFLSCGVLILSLTLFLFFFSFFHSLSLLVFLFVILFLSLSLSLLVCITVSHFMILLDFIWFIV